MSSGALRREGKYLFLWKESYYQSILQYVNGFILFWYSKTLFDHYVGLGFCICFTDNLKKVCLLHSYTVEFQKLLTDSILPAMVSIFSKRFISGIGFFQTLNGIKISIMTKYSQAALFLQMLYYHPFSVSMLIPLMWISPKRKILRWLLRIDMRIR